MSQRDDSAPAKRVLIIGLDGATFDVLNPLVEQGRMPRLGELLDRGASGILHSTVPPITPAAWTTFLTGKNPGAHGIIDFERYDVTTNTLRLNSTRRLAHVRSLWQILGDQGRRIGSINVPMTYPPEPVNGFLISGFETPGPHSDFVYPPEIKERILKQWPDPTLRTKWRRGRFGVDDRLFQENVAYMANSFHQGAEMTQVLGDEHGWDVLMVVLKLIDNLQHKTWKHLDPRWADREPRRRDIARWGFEEADRALGRMLDYAREKDAHVLVVSDHGHGSLEGKVQPNLLLKRWGYLRLRGGAARSATRGRFMLDRWLGRTKRFARDGDVAHELAVDFTRTRACVMHAGMAGFLYINLAGRQPCGIVPPDEYDALRDELCERLLSDDCCARDPQGRVIQLFSAVHKPEELYGCSRADQPWMPDLILVPHESLAVVRKIRGRAPVRWLSYRKMEGTHRSEGIVIAAGEGIAPTRDLQAGIIDCAPTILAMLGLPVPDDMQGRVLKEMFERPLTTRSVAATGPSDGAGGEEVYTQEDLQAITDRLSDLGYLE